MSSSSTAARMLLLIALLSIISTGNAEFSADPDDKRQVNAEKAIAKMKDKAPRSQQFFDDAYGFAVYTSVTRVGLGFGGAYGKGLVIDNDAVIGSTGFWQFSSGIQAGAKNFTMVIFFKDKAALDYFKTGKIQFLGQAGIDVATVGVAGTPAYDEGVAIITMTRLGLMAEFAATGAKFTYKPIARK